MARPLAVLQSVGNRIAAALNHGGLRDLQRLLRCLLPGMARKDNPVPRENTILCDSSWSNVRVRLSQERLGDERLSTREIARRVMAARGLNEGNERSLRLIEKRIWSYLRRRAGGLVEIVGKEGRRMAWRVAG